MMALIVIGLSFNITTIQETGELVTGELVCIHALFVKVQRYIIIVDIYRA